MAKYIAIKDFPPNIKQGDEAEFADDLDETLKPYFTPAGGAASAEKVENQDTDDTIITNPDREKLKARATELEIPFAPNIPTARLIELIKEKEAAQAEDSGDSDEGEDSDDSANEGDNEE
jgi:hypothetical protein